MGWVGVLGRAGGPSPSPSLFVSVYKKGTTMRDVELLADLIERLVRDVRAEVAELSSEELSWQPDPEANNIGVTVWHFSRWLDMLAIQALANRSAAEELWQ